MSEIEDRVLNNMKFRDILKDNLVNNPWLLNYELGFAELPQSEGGGKGTVYSAHGQTGKNEYTVLPTIMENKEGELQFYKNFKDEADKRGYGIKFSSPKEAEDFSIWLHELHQMSGEGDGQSYEL
tara:strand:+ start:118 stop:492 length:375 start_codon:yes stop_codon:yes gene_type:complete